MSPKSYKKALRIGEETYTVIISLRKRKGASLSYSKKEPKTFLCSASTAYRHHLDELEAFIASAAPKLLRRIVEIRSSQNSYYEDGYLYVLGERRYVGEMSEGEAFEKLKKIALPYFTERTLYWKEKMGIDNEFNVRIRTMKTRFGVNCLKTKRIFFTTLAICYHPDIVDYLIIHELAHFRFTGHQQNFYKLVSKYDPSYKIHQAQLKRGNYDGDNHQPK